MRRNTLSWRLLTAVLLLTLAGGALAAERIFTIVTDIGMVNHWPGPDALIGTIDDHVSGDNIEGWSGPGSGSYPNANGSYSYNAFDFGAPFAPLHLPEGMNGVTFVEGQVIADKDVAVSGGGSILMDWDLTGTEPFVGHDVFSSTILNVNSGTYNPATHAFTVNVDFQANLAGTIDSSLGFVLAGTGWLIDEADFGTATGVPYIDDVLIPLAQSKSATGLFFIQGTGTIPAAEGGNWGSMPMEAVLVGIALLETPTVPSNWGLIKKLY